MRALLLMLPSSPLAGPLATSRHASLDRQVTQGAVSMHTNASRVYSPARASSFLVRNDVARAFTPCVGDLGFEKEPGTDAASRLAMK